MLQQTFLREPPQAAYPKQTHLLELLVTLQQQDINRLQIVDERVALKLLPDFGANSRGGEVDGVELGTVIRSR